MRITFDSNVLVYAVDSETPEKHATARRLLLGARDADVVLTAQALGEFVNVFRRKKRAFFSEALIQAARFNTIFPVIPTTADHILESAEFAERHRLQLWDSVIWKVARSAGATLFISEDMQDGLSLDGMVVIDPFRPANAIALDELLFPAGG